ncbi:hypothetical protein QBC40DRAFT_275259 [Triangularia verruculosa]|uniref:Uncharacterized protein n=1 Tax=Triangularia verruculosa TaxID=2587418 RepID=A0AAN6XR18_9PEZI|nr:hypothetical protein QBC40DRAFT_275259 [Triangularia verruculosa]
MCGEETPSNLPRVGARVDFYSSSTRQPLGNLLFHNPSIPSSSSATHVRFSSPSSACSSRSSSPIPEYRDDDVLVSIHVSGDMSKPIRESGLLQQFTLPSTSGEDGCEVALREELSLVVGIGIIGRRVSMTKGDEVLADGIIGFNTLPDSMACL